MIRLQVPSPAVAFALAFTLLPLLLPAQELSRGQSGHARRHDDPLWLAVEPHLPNPATATPSVLENQADLLRVRRFPEDALDFYNYAVKRGGSTATLMNKIGLTQLELRNVVLAQGFFHQAIKIDKRNSQGWNNLAATEYLGRQYGLAVGDYKRAVKLDKNNAVFHANLSTAYFESKDYKRARKEADEAMRLDPQVFHRSNGSGISAHVLSISDKARFSFEMAKLYAHNGMDDEMLHALAVASESGFDITANMGHDPDLAKYRNDPRVTELVLTAKAMHRGETTAVASAAGLKATGAADAR